MMAAIGLLPLDRFLKGEESVAERMQPIPAMFDRIAYRYDFLNRCLSFGQDVIWRKKVGSYLPSHDNLHVLDLATGTGDLAISLISNHHQVTDIVGLDLSENMLEIGRAKIHKAGLANCIQLRTGDATHIDMENNSFDVVTIAFGIRNVTDVALALSEMYRCLKVRGRLIILEFSLPSNRLIRALYLFYFRYWLPLFGGIISGDKSAYRYLNQSAENFPYGETFLQRLGLAGFKNAKAHVLTFGVVTIYVAEKDVA